MTSPSPSPSPEPEREADEKTLPDRSRDDLDLGWGERHAAERDDDERFLRERPPHWE